MKRLFSILIAWVAYVTVNADNVTTLVLELNDGTSNSFIFSEMPIITMPEDNVKVISNSFSIEVIRNDVKRFYFTDKETAINSPEAENSIMVNCMDKNNIYISGLKNGQNVNIYTIGGILAGTSKASLNGDAIVTLNGRQNDVYIIKCGNKSFKFNF